MTTTGTSYQFSSDGMTGYYGSSQVLFGVDMKIRKGEIVALLGRNGAGKTTCFRALMGLIRREGALWLAGQDVSALPTHQLARAGLGYVPEDRQVFPLHTVDENLRIGTKAGEGGHLNWTLAKVYETFPILKRLERRHAGLLSGGEQQMLTIGRTLMGNPGVLLLDEPSEGLAPIIVQEIEKLLHTLRASGQTVILAEQNTQFCMRVATHAMVLDKGRIVFAGTREAFLADKSIETLYLSA